MFCQEGKHNPSYVPFCFLRDIYLNNYTVFHANNGQSDYGFAWTPHGTYARDLAHFKNLLGFTAHESIIAATAGVAKLFMREHELGQIKPGYYADCILVDGNPLQEIEVLQDHSKLNVILINGRVHKAGREEYLPPPIPDQKIKNRIVAEVEFPDAKREMQKQQVQKQHC